MTADEKDAFLRDLSEAGIEADEAAELLAGIVEPIAPPTALRATILSAARGGTRLERFAEQVGRALDVAVERARELLAGVDVDDNFETGPVEGVRLYHVKGGPAVAGAITGFIRIAPGDAFPPHSHLGRETVLVVQGSYRDSDGSIVRAGDIVTKDVGQEHSFVALPGPDLVYLGVIEDGIRIGGEDFLPGDPRI